LEKAHGRKERSKYLSLIEEFNNAYSMLEDKLYTSGAMSYKETRGGSKEAEEILDRLIDTKAQVDARMRYLVRTIYRRLKIEYEK